MKAIVTLALGDRYLSNWKKYCRPGWRRYADRHHYDLIWIETALDKTDRASARSPSWQKCLILSQDWSQKYDQIVWLDSDIMINPGAPDIGIGCPDIWVGAVEDKFDRMLLNRIYRLWPEDQVVKNYSARQYYENYGLAPDIKDSAGILTGMVDRTFNAGVLVLSPKYHRELLEHVYFDYEEKPDGERKWHMEQRPLSYEVVKAGLVAWLDPRFNVNLWSEEYLHYPFFQTDPAFTKKGLIERFLQRLGLRREDNRMAFLKEIHRSNRNTEAVNAVFQRSFFLHFCSTIDQMALVRQQPAEWWDVLLPIPKNPQDLM